MLVLSRKIFFSPDQIATTCHITAAAGAIVMFVGLWRGGVAVSLKAEHRKSMRPRHP